MNNFELDIALQEADAEYNAAEAQGIACGLLTVNISADIIAWVKMIFGEVHADDTKQTNAIELSGKLFEETKMLLQDSNLGFELLLPDEDEDLYSRFSALQQWCSAYVVGITMAGIKDISKLPEDSRELIADFTEIGTSGDFDLDDEDSSEEAFLDISEYVRVGVLLINEELQPIKQSSQIH